MSDALTESEQNAVNYLRHAIAVEEAKIGEATAKKTALTEAMWSIETILERGHDA